MKNKELPKKRKTYQKGKMAETLALWWLRLKGYRLVARNVVVGKGTKANEIDLIVCRGKTVVFVEVKRRPTITAGLQAISIQAQQRIVCASSVFLSHNTKFSNYSVRYDVVCIAPWKLPYHLEDAWRVL